MLPTSLPPGFIEPCLPTAPDRCKSGTDWVHEIKHDGYRLIARRTDDRVRLYTCRGFNRADRYPRIVEALRSLPVRSITIDGRGGGVREGRQVRFRQAAFRAHTTRPCSCTASI
jgi:ATP-dependent DNA ligase